jgi:hypothetical protein
MPKKENTNINYLGADGSISKIPETQIILIM